MPKNKPARATANHLLTGLSDQDYALLEPGLKTVALPVRFPIEMPETAIKHVYFVERGIVSVVATDARNRSIEVGIIGPEGMTGLAVIMGEERAAQRAFVQLAGAAARISANDLRRAIDRSRTLHQALLRFGHCFMTQTANTALANGQSTIEGRLARWLLMAHDRIEGDDVKLTHEFLSVMLGVRRAGVTEALKLLQSAGAIRAARGIITIVSRHGLEKSAGGTYVPAPAVR